MRKLLLAFALFNTFALATHAQTPRAPSPPDGSGLTLGRPGWTSFGVEVTSVGPVGGQGGGGVRGRGYGDRSSADYQPHMQQALANAYPRPATSPSVRWARSLRRASVALTNGGTKTVKSVSLDFVFTDPSTGAEVNRIRHRSKKTLRPGETDTTTKEVMGSARHRRGDGMQVSAELTEVVYADGSVWRP
jgi:hypothetical protein